MQGKKIPTILLVDDDVSILRLIKSALETANYRVVTAKSGEEALNVVSRQRPDIVLLDVSMPGMSGMEVCRRIKLDKANKYLPVILVTAQADLTDRVEGFTSGADDYLCKPFELEELRSRVAAHLRTGKLLEKLVDDARENATIEGVRCTLITMAHYINNANQSVLGTAQLCEKYPQEPRYAQKLASTCLHQIPKVTAVIRAMETLVSDPELKTLPYISNAKERIWDIEDKINTVLTELTKEESVEKL